MNKKYAPLIVGILLFASISFAMASPMEIHEIHLNGIEHTIQVANSNATYMLQERLQFLNQTQLQLLNRLNYTEAKFENNQLRIEGRIQSKFLGIVPLQRKISYTYQNNELIRNRNVLDFLWKNN